MKCIQPYMSSLTQVWQNLAVPPPTTTASIPVASQNCTGQSSFTGSSWSGEWMRRASSETPMVIQWHQPQQGVFSSLVNWSTARRMRNALPTVHVALDPHAALMHAPGEVGIDAQGVNWPALRSFDNGVLARFHNVHADALETAGRTFAAGGPADMGTGRDSFWITDERSRNQGDVVLTRTLSAQFELQVEGLTTVQYDSVARGSVFQMAPDRIVRQRIEDTLCVLVSRVGEGKLQQDEVAWAKARMELAERLVTLVAPKGLDRIRRNRSQIRRGPELALSSELILELCQEPPMSMRGHKKLGGVYLEATPMDRHVRLAINVFLAALIDVFAMADAEYEWVCANLRKA